MLSGAKYVVKCQPVKVMSVMKDIGWLSHVVQLAKAAGTRSLTMFVLSDCFVWSYAPYTVGAGLGRRPLLTAFIPRGSK